MKSQEFTRLVLPDTSPIALPVSQRNTFVNDCFPWPQHTIRCPSVKTRHVSTLIARTMIKIHSNTNKLTFGPRDVVHGAGQWVVLSLECHVLVEPPHADAPGDVAGRHPLAVRGNTSHGTRVLMFVKASRDLVAHVPEDDVVAAGVGDEL